MRDRFSVEHKFHLETRPDNCLLDTQNIIDAENWFKKPVIKFYLELGFVCLCTLFYSYYIFIICIEGIDAGGVGRSFISTITNQINEKSFFFSGKSGFKFFNQEYEAIEDHF